MLTNERLKEIRGLAESHTGKASALILELLDDMAALRRLKLRQGLTAVSVLDPWPYHPHLDKTFAEVPEDYLLKWRDERSRDVLMHDVCLGIIAARDLRLYDLIGKLASKPKDPEPNAIKNKDLPDTGQIQGSITI